MKRIQAVGKVWRYTKYLPSVLQIIYHSEITALPNISDSCVEKRQKWDSSWPLQIHGLLKLKGQVHLWLLNEDRETVSVAERGPRWPPHSQLRSKEPLEMWGMGGGEQWAEGLEERFSRNLGLTDSCLCHRVASSGIENAISISPFSPDQQLQWGPDVVKGSQTLVCTISHFDLCDL